MFFGVDIDVCCFFVVDDDGGYLFVWDVGCEIVDGFCVGEFGEVSCYWVDVVVCY